MNIMKLIDKTLNRYLPHKTVEPGILHRAMRYSVFSKGKRLRPILLMESARACGGREKDAAAAGCAVELVHAYSLIHDDLPSMDDDDFRRGKPSCHKAFGEANAILAGDALLALALNIMSRELPPGTSALAIEELSGAIGSHGMAGGQALDLRFRGTKNIKLRNKINLLKTAKLFEASAKIGAIVAGANAKKIRAMAGYGLNFGLAFQTIDDMIDGEGPYSSPSEKEKAAVYVEGRIRRANASLNIFGAKAVKLKMMAGDLLDKIR